nr:phosphate-starvation-inducible PsiE family protein [uncultured Flavobacterium sp.]
MLLTVVMIYSMLEIVLITLRTIFVKNEIINFLNPTIDRNNLFITSVQGFIAATLLIAIIIEVIESLREYQKKNKINYVKVILEIAIIAVIRHVLIIDFEHANAGILIGVSSLILVLGLFYLILNKNIKTNQNEN